MKHVHEFLAALVKVKSVGRDAWMAQCPSHDDRRASLSVKVADDGKILLKCHAGCLTETVLGQIGMKFENLFPESEQDWKENRAEERKTFVIKEEYDYHDESGVALYQAVRMEPKDFRQRHKGADGKWIWNLDGVRRVPYRLPQTLQGVAEGHLIYLVEGEKDANALVSLGLHATCNSGGAEKWWDECTEALRGADVVMLPDNDKAGRGHVALVSKHLKGIAKSVRVLELPKLPEKGDVSDWLATGGSREALEQLVVDKAYDGFLPKPLPQKSAPSLTREYPNAEASEAALIGTLISHSEDADALLSDVTALVTAEDFQNPLHRAVMGCIVSIAEAGDAVTAQTVASCVASKRKLAPDVALQIVEDYVSHADTASALAFHAKTVCEMARFRRVMTHASTLYEQALACDREGVSAAVGKVSRVASDTSEEDTLKPLSHYIQVAYDALEERSQKKGFMSGVDTGFADLNWLTTGFSAGELIVIAARPGMGKTSIAMQMVQAAATSGKPALFFSLEMPASQLVERMLSAVSRVPFSKIRTASMTETEWQALSDAALILARIPVWIDDTRVCTVPQIRSKVARFIRQHGEVSEVCVDYLQLVQPVTATGNEVRDIGSISIALKTMAREVGVPVLALAQLSRSVEQRADKRPQLSDLRSSGQIEQDADVVIFIHREEYYKKGDVQMVAEEGGAETMKMEKAELIVAKQRNGARDTVTVGFWADLVRFDNLTTIEH